MLGVMTDDTAQQISNLTRLLIPISDQNGDNRCWWQSVGGQILFIGVRRSHIWGDIGGGKGWWVANPAQLTLIINTNNNDDKKSGSGMLCFITCPARGFERGGCYGRIGKLLRNLEMLVVDGVWNVDCWWGMETVWMPESPDQNSWQGLGWWDGEGRPDQIYSKFTISWYQSQILSRSRPHKSQNIHLDPIPFYHFV